MAGPPPPLLRPLHPDRILLDQPGGTLVRLPHRPEDPPRRPQVVQALEADIRQWIEHWNENPKPFAWVKTADEILSSLAEYMSKISGAPH
jgi:hypothetical protein